VEASLPSFSRVRGGVLAAAVLATLFATPSASASPRTGPPEAPEGTLAASAVEVMNAGDELLPNEYLESPNGDYALFVEPNGLLTVYGPTGPLWIRDDTENAVALVFQGDGNLVAYGAGAVPLWASGTSAPGGAVVMQNDGNLVIYRAGGIPVWASKSTPSFGQLPDRLLPGQQLALGTSLVSDNCYFSLVLQMDRNLVVYGPGGPIWATGTSNPGGSALVMQGDGNLVLYINGVPSWHTQTRDLSGVHLVVQDDGNVVLYRPDGTPIWASMSSRGFPLRKTTLLTGERLSPGQFLVSPNQQYRMVVQADGNLVVYGPVRPNWASGNAVAGSSLVNRPDGDMVVALSPTAKATWHTGTSFPWAGGAGQLVMQDDGNLVLYRNGAAAWASLVPGTWRTTPLPLAPPGGWW
jgi:hypothetical protein